MVRPSLLCVALSLALLPLVSSAAQDDSPMPWQSVTELQQRMDAGKLNTKTLVRDDLTRIRRIDHDTLQDDLTIDDPKAYKKPWMGRQVFKLRPTWHLLEYVCSDSRTGAPK